MERIDSSGGLAPAGLSRRRLLNLAGFSVAALVLPGCGGGGSSNLFATQPVGGTVNTSELGSGNLRVVTASNAGGTAVQGGSFQTAASGKGSQALFVVDPGDRVWGLTMTEPGSGDLMVDARSTVLALFLLNPGLYSADPSELAATSASIQSQSGFDALVRRARLVLPGGGVAALVNDEPFRDGYTASIQALIAARGERGITVGDPAGGLSIQLADTSNPASVMAKLTNSGPRFLRVNRRDLNAAASTIRVENISAEEPAQFPGRLAGSLGAVFLPGQGTTISDITAEDYTSTATAEFWGEGIGLGTSVPLPADVTSNPLPQYGMSLVLYMAVPFLVALMGSDAVWQRAAADRAAAAAHVWSLMAGDATVRSKVSSVVAAQDEASFYAALGDASEFVIQQILSKKQLYGAFGITDAAAGSISRVAEFLYGFFGYVLVGYAGHVWASMPKTYRVVVTSTGGGSVTIG